MHKCSLQNQMLHENVLKQKAYMYSTAIVGLHVQTKDNRSTVFVLKKNQYTY